MVNPSSRETLTPPLSRAQEMVSLRVSVPPESSRKLEHRRLPIFEPAERGLVRKLRCCRAPPAQARDTRAELRGVVEEGSPLRFRLSYNERRRSRRNA
jgi:hypothetical protein